jgi:hypothetical protein
METSSIHQVVDRVARKYCNFIAQPYMQGATTGSPTDRRKPRIRIQNKTGFSTERGQSIVPIFRLSFKKSS